MPPHLRNQQLSELPEGAPVHHYNPSQPPPNYYQNNVVPMPPMDGMRKSQSFAGVQHQPQVSLIVNQKISKNCKELCGRLEQCAAAECARRIFRKPSWRPTRWWGWRRRLQPAAWRTTAWPCSRVPWALLL